MILLAHGWIYIFEFLKNKNYKKYKNDYENITFSCRNFFISV